jgi:hypothetical protein
MVVQVIVVCISVAFKTKKWLHYVSHCLQLHTKKLNQTLKVLGHDSQLMVTAISAHYPLPCMLATLMLKGS